MSEHGKLPNTLETIERHAVSACLCPQGGDCRRTASSRLVVAGPPPSIGQNRLTRPDRDRGLDRLTATSDGAIPFI